MGRRDYWAVFSFDLLSPYAARVVFTSGDYGFPVITERGSENIVRVAFQGLHQESGFRIPNSEFLKIKNGF